MKFVSLGSGSSGNCYFLCTAQTSILIDAGVGARTMRRYFRDLGMQMGGLDAVFITHDHADHIKAVATFANEFNIPLYTTEKVYHGITRNYAVSGRIAPEKMRFLQKTVGVTVGDLTVTPFEVPHDSTDCVGYRVEHGGITFCLITDVGHATPTIEQEVARANYLVLEANHDEDMLNMGPYPAYLKGRIKSEQGHLSNKSAATLLAKHATPALHHVWLCHLSEENNHPELARKTVESILQSYGIQPGTDFKIEILKRKTPSEVYELNEN